MPDMFTPLDQLNKMAPHNVLASIFAGGQFNPAQDTTEEERTGTLGAQRPSGGQGQGQGSSSSSSDGATPGNLTIVSGGPGFGAGADTTGGLRHELTFPSMATIKVIDKETKLPVIGAAVYSDDFPVGVTNAKGKLETSELPVGKHVLSVDAVGYDLVEKEIITPPPNRMMQKFNYDFEVSFIEMPGEEEAGEAAAGASTAAETAAGVATGATGGYEGGGYFGGGAPTYEAPTYNAPVYNAPSYPSAPPAQQAPSAGALPLPPIDWLQQFMMLPFSTLQKAFSMPMSSGGQIALFGKPRREILGYCPAGKGGK